VLPVQISAEFLTELFETIEKDPSTELIIDLPKQTLTVSPSGKSDTFEINDYKKENMLNGYDDIDYLNNIKEDIQKFASSTPL
jgi:3-isopropylmalate/(R)-2-methylmalate dehydratase small subunit